MVIPVFDLHLRFTHGSLKCFMGLEYENIHFSKHFVAAVFMKENLPVSWSICEGFFLSKLSSRLRITPPPLRVAPLDSSCWGEVIFLKEKFMRQLVFCGGAWQGRHFLINCQWPTLLNSWDYRFISRRKNKVFKPLIS